MVGKVVRLFNREFNTINEAALLLGVFTLLSQLLGLVRDRLLAHHLGASIPLDIYNTAFRIPDILFAVAASLVSVTILIPFLAEKLAESRGVSRQFINEVFTVFFAAIVVIAVIVGILMPHIAPLIAPGFGEAELAELVRITRIMLLQPVLLGLSNILSTITQAFKKFFVYALSPVFYNVGIILGIILLYPLFGLPGLAYGVVIGALLHFLIQLPVVVRERLTPKLTRIINWQEIKRVVLISLPRTLTLSFTQIILLVFFALATRIGEGSVSIFKFAYNLQAVPLALIGMSFSVAAFPTLVQYFTRNDRKSFLEHIIGPARQIIFWSIPIVVLFVVLRAHIVRVVLGSGAFDWADTRLTAAALAIFALAVTAESLILLLVRGYYAAGKTTRPLIVNGITAIVAITLGFVLIRAFETNPGLQIFIERLLRVEGVGGTAVLMLPLAYAVGLVANFLVLWGMFKYEFFRGYQSVLSRTFLESLLASLAMGVVTYYFLQIFSPIFDINTFRGVFLQGLLAGLIGITVAGAMLVLMRNREFEDFFAALKRKFWKTKLFTAGDSGEI